MKVAVFGGNRSATYMILEYMLKQNVEIVAYVHEGEMRQEIAELCKSNGIYNCSDKKMYEDLNEGIFPRFDLGISYLYHKILRPKIIDFANGNIINFHPAPTDVHRGVAACCYCLLNDYSEWAVTAHYVTPGVDDGDIIQQRKFQIDSALTGQESERFIQKQSFLLFCDVLNQFINSGPIERKKQEKFQGVYYSRSDLERDKKVSLDDDNDIINKKINAFWFPPYHGAYIEINGEKYTLVNEDLLKKLVDR